MTLKEANSLLKKEITSEQLDIVHPLYAMLKFEKADFCKIIDAVGIEKLTEKTLVIERLDMAEREWKKYEEYEAAKEQLARLNREEQRYREIVENYKPLIRPINHEKF